jgi:WD40 repeat protein
MLMHRSIAAVHRHCRPANHDLTLPRTITFADSSLERPIIRMTAGERLATVTGDRRWHLWDARTGKVLMESPQLNWYVYDLAFTPDGKKLVVQDRHGVFGGGTDELTHGTVQLWPAQSGAALSTTLAAYRPVMAASFTAGGSNVLVSSARPGRRRPVRHGLGLTDGRKPISTRLD